MNEERKELVAFRMSRSRETLHEVNLHLENQLWFTAINRLYYACFYAVNALLYHNEIETKTHSGARQMFGQHFIKTGIIPKELGEFYTDLFTKRHKGDYDDMVSFEKEDVLPLVQPAADLIEKIDALIQSH